MKPDTASRNARQRKCLHPGREHDRLKDYPVDLLDMICHKPNDVADTVIIQSVLHSHLQRGFHSRGGDIVEGASLHLHVVADPAMTVLRFGNAIELEIYGVESCRLCLDRKILLLGKANSIGGDV